MNRLPPFKDYGRRPIRAEFAELRNTNAFKFILQVFILSQKHILGVKKVVWDGLDEVWGGLEVVWGVLGWFGVFPRTRYVTHFYCLAVEAGFYSDVVECLPVDPAAWVRFPAGAGKIFSAPCDIWWPVSRPVS